MIVRASRSRSAIQTRRFTRSEYERMAAAGILRPDEQLELLDGQIVLKEPQTPRHCTVALLIMAALAKAFGRGHDVRPRAPLRAGRSSEPEPDIAVVAGSPDDYLEDHPSTAILVVEVSESALAIDRQKAAIYAEAGIPEYWIANLVEGVVEVHRGPEEAANGEWTYAEIKRVMKNGTIQPLAAPKTKLKVADLLR